MDQGGEAHEGRVAYERAHAELASIPLPFEDFRRAWASVRESGAADPGRSTDVYLALACAAGSDEAWVRLRDSWFPRVRGFLFRRGAGDREVEDLLNDLPGYLCDIPGDGPGRARIASYRGESSLLTWLVVVSVRLLERRRRDAGNTPGLPDSEGMPPEGGAGPLERVVGRERARRFETVLHQAWGTLTAKECLAVLFRYRDGLPQKEIARLLSVGEPRVSRLLEAGVSRLRDEVRGRLRETPPGDDTGEKDLWKALGEVVAREMARSGPKRL